MGEGRETNERLVCTALVVSRQRKQDLNMGEGRETNERSVCTALPSKQTVF